MDTLMAQNVVKNKDYSFQGVKREGMGYKTKALLVFVLCMLVNMQITTQYIASAFGYHSALGWSISLKGVLVYPFYRSLYWLYILMSTYEESRSKIAATSAFIFSVGMMLSVYAAKKC